MIVTNENIKSVLADIRNQKRLSLDTETTGLRPYHGDSIFGVSVATARGFYYFNFKRYEEVEPLNTSVIKDLYQAFVGKLVFMANPKFDFHFLSQHSWGTDFRVFDVLVADKCIYNEHLQYNLKAVAERYGMKKSGDVMDYVSKYRLYDKVQVPGKKTVSRNPRFDWVPFQVISEYALNDARVTFDIGEKQIREINKLTKLYGSIVGFPKPFIDVVRAEMELIPVLFRMEQRGMEIDYDYIKKAEAFEENRAEEAKDRFIELTDTALIDSPKSIGRALKARGVIPGRTEKGRESFTDEVLSRSSDEAAACLREFRDATKRTNTYYRNFTYSADSSGVVRPSIRQAGAATFRFSITEPALQTLTSEDDGDWLVRDSFRARSGYRYVSIDYQAQEYRIAADLSGQCDLIDRINAGEDVHSATAAMMGVTRKEAKTLNFMLLYGGGAQKLAGALSVSLARAKELKALYFEKLPEISNFITRATAKAEERGKVFNPFGRMLHFPVVEFKNERGVTERVRFSYKATNYLIQSTGAEIMRAALIKIDSFLIPYKSKLLLSIHDELLFEIHESEMFLINPIRKLMESSYTPKNGCFMKTSVAIGKTWGRLDDITDEELAEREHIQKAGRIQASENPPVRDIHDSANVYSGHPGFTDLRGWEVRGT